MFFYDFIVGNDLKPYFLIVVDNKFIYRHEPGLIDYTKSPIHESPTNSITGKQKNKQTKQAQHLSLLDQLNQLTCCQQVWPFTPVKVLCSWPTTMDTSTS